MPTIGKTTKKSLAAQKRQQQTVAKSNDLIQQGRFPMSIQQGKVILYMISQIRPNDTGNEIYRFSINEFCRACNIDYDSGKNISDVKRALKAIADMSVWVEQGNGVETLLRWLSHVMLDKRNNVFEISFSKDMLPYLYDLKTRYTSYALSNVLAMESKYGIRLYELLKSYQHVRDGEVTFDIDELQKRIDAETYKRYPDFKRRALDVAIQDINEYSDISVEYEAFSENGGRRIDTITFTIKEPEGLDKEIRTIRRERKLDTDGKSTQRAFIEAMKLEN